MDIDWSKPVECSYEDNGTQYYPVVFHVDNPSGSKICVVQRPNGWHFSVLFDERSLHRFRNVRRKVKREAWLVLWPDGTIHCYYDSGAKNIAAPLGGEVRHIEWEADADE